MKEPEVQKFNADLDDTKTKKQESEDHPIVTATDNA